mmetsp:Transcript_57701/g.134436  ORF Transcript_57701/g.134436 Transcript_57701/m.134436 type:complete len:228 (-) Transcript_57701:806-1489(-)
MRYLTSRSKGGFSDNEKLTWLTACKDITKRRRMISLRDFVRSSSVSPSASRSSWLPDLHCTRLQRASLRASSSSPQSCLIVRWSRLSSCTLRAAYHKSLKAHTSTSSSRSCRNIRAPRPCTQPSLFVNLTHPLKLCLSAKINSPELRVLRTCASGLGCDLTSALEDTTFRQATPCDKKLLTTSSDKLSMGRRTSPSPSSPSMSISIQPQSPFSRSVLNHPFIVFSNP